MAQRQLQFEITLNPERRPEIRIPPNKTVSSEDKSRLSRQAKAIYEMLQTGPVTTSQLSGIACQYGARVFEVRRYLVGQGQMIDEIKGSGGENQYRIVSLENSTFWRKVKEKNEVWKWK